MTASVMDLFHLGHQNLLKRMREQSDLVLVVLHEGWTTYANKKKFPIENLEKRTMNLIGSGLVDIVKHTYLVNPADTFEEIIERYKDFEIEFFRGDDWADFPGIEAIKEAGIKITYLPYTREISSTILRDQL